MSDSGSEGPVLGIRGIDSEVEVGRSDSHTTYRVRDTATDKTFVIKLLHAGRDQAGLEERFEREQSTMAALAHPNILPVLGHGWSETGVPFIVSGEVPSESIIDKLRGPAPPTGPDILDLGVRFAGALESAHRAGVVHGAVRPDDMAVTPQGELLLADFGVATVARHNAADVTDPADLAHVAPELLEGQPATASSDLYSLTSALFTLFTGLTAYVRPDDQSVIAVMKRIASDPLPEMRAQHVPGPLVDVISTGMAKDPAQRYPSARDLGQSLQQAQVALGLPMTEMTIVEPKERPAPAARPASDDPAADTSEDAPEVDETVPEEEETLPEEESAPEDSTLPPVEPTADRMWDDVPPNRTPLIIAAAAVVAVVVIAVAAFLATRSDDDSETSGSTTSTTASTAGQSTTITTGTTGTTVTTGPTLTTPNGGSLLTSAGGRLTLNVPTSWPQHSTVDTEEGLPELQASPDLAEFAGTTFLQPGIDFIVYPADYLDPTDLGGVLDHLLTIDRGGRTLETLCTRGSRTDFTPNGDGLAAGLFERLTACNGGGGVMIIAATNAERSFTVVIEVHVGSPPDDDGVDLVTSTFDVVQFP